MVIFARASEGVSLYTVNRRFNSERFALARLIATLLASAAVCVSLPVQSHAELDVVSLKSAIERSVERDYPKLDETLAGAIMRAMTDPPPAPKAARTVMNIRSAEGAFVTVNGDEAIN